MARRISIGTFIRNPANPCGCGIILGEQFLAGFSFNISNLTTSTSRRKDHKYQLPWSGERSLSRQGCTRSWLHDSATEAHSEREVDKVRARQRDRERRTAVEGASEWGGRRAVVVGVGNEGWAKAKAAREKKRRNETLDAGYKYTRRWHARDYTYTYRRWCMVCHDGSNSGIPGLKLAQHRGSVGKLPAPRLKGFVVAAPLLSRQREQLFAMLMRAI